MRALKLILAALFAAAAAAIALLAGVVAAAVVAGIGLAVYLSRRLLGRPRAESTATTAPRRRPMADTEAIEVSATEVAADSAAAANTQTSPPPLPFGSGEPKL